MKNLILLLVPFICLNHAHSQIDVAPDRVRGEGPFNQLIIRGVTLINGNGAPPTGPVDITVEGNKIVSIQNVGYPGLEIKEDSRPKLKKGGKEINAEKMYSLPGFITFKCYWNIFSVFFLIIRLFRISTPIFIIMMIIFRLQAFLN